MISKYPKLGFHKHFRVPELPYKYLLKYKIVHEKSAKRSLQIALLYKSEILIYFYFLKASILDMFYNYSKPRPQNIYKSSTNASKIIKVLKLLQIWKIFDSVHPFFNNIKILKLDFHRNFSNSK